MDPVTAVGLAASILTFVEFSLGIITGTYEVYKSSTGTTSENAHISTVIDDLEKVTDGLISDVQGKTKHEKELCNLADKCHDLSQDLSKILKKLQVAGKSSKWKSLKVQIASMRKGKEIASIEGRLDKYRSQILVRLNFMLSEQQSSVKAQLDTIQKEGSRLSTETATQFICLRQEINLAVKRLLEAKDKIKQNEEGETVHASKDKIKQIQDEEMVSLSKDICSALSKLQSMSTSLSRENQILGRLYFDNMYTREDTIADAESGTFRWIVQETNDKLINSPEEYPHWKREAKEEMKRRKHTRDSFLEWLNSGNQIYHISGKPGSGKSTLMKFLCQHPRVKKELESWAAEKKLIFAQFFFWNSGEKLQMSLEGLYRSLLFEVLKQYPDLISEVFPDAWNASDSVLPRFESPSFRLPEIKAAFDRLVSKNNFPAHRICIFIDGLDEYEDCSIEHWKLANRFQKWAGSTDIKICVSSREHPEFMDTFSGDPDHRLRLHELTQYDIGRYACAMFEKDTNFNRVKDIYMELVGGVVQAANGVFLWAYLVVRSLLEGVGHRASTSALKVKLNSAPRDLNDLYDKLLGSIDPSDRRRSDQMLLIAAGDAPRDPLNALAYSWLEDLDDPNFPFSSPVQGCSDEEIEKRHIDLRPQLQSLSKGLLEMGPDARADGDLYFKYSVQFFHRTVRDYLRDDSRQSQLQLRLPNFQLVEVYSRLCLAELKFARTRESYFQDTENFLELVFWHSHSWQKRLSWNGAKVPFNFAKEVSTVLDGYRQLPFSHPGEKGDNPGIIKWGMAMSLGRIRHRDDVIYRGPENDLSYLHWAACFNQYEYVTSRVLENPSLIKGDGELNLLLSASIEGGPGLVRFLLEQASAGPQDRIRSAQQNQSESDVKISTVWMLFLLCFGVVTFYSHAFQPAIDCFSAVLEEYLKFGVETDILFLLTPRASTPGGVGATDIPPSERAVGTRGNDEELFSVSLEEMIRMSQPKNLNALQALLQYKAKGPFLGMASSVISKFFPRSETSIPIASEYKTLAFDELVTRQFSVVGVYSKKHHLERDFRFRIY